MYMYQTAFPKADLNKMKRTPFETVPIFAQRLRILYTGISVFAPSSRNPLQEEGLIQTFTRALEDEDAERHPCPRLPIDLQLR